MPGTLELFPPDKTLRAEIELPASKSHSNRLLVLEYVSDGLISAGPHSDAEDSVRLQEILAEKPEIADAGAGGTTFRFALAALSATEGYAGTLKGSERLHQRPVKPLVDALKALGADIEYTGQDGYPPLKVRGKKLKGGKVELSGKVSSQFLSALALISPLLEDGLTIDTGGEVTSRPYLEMTLQLLKDAGITVRESGDIIEIGPGELRKMHFDVEKDWSSASYWYSLVALSPSGEITMKGLKLQSLQGDADTAKIYSGLGVETVEFPEGIRIRKAPVVEKHFEIDFSNTPDLAQSVAVTIAGLEATALLKGLKTLRVKETDRIAALRTELEKINVFTSEPAEGELYIDATKADFSRTLIAHTYEDHRMAMAFMPLVYKAYRTAIRDSDVVRKSYPKFWEQVRKCGITIREPED